MRGGGRKRGDLQSVSTAEWRARQPFETALARSRRKEWLPTSIRGANCAPGSQDDGSGGPSRTRTAVATKTLCTDKSRRHRNVPNRFLIDSDSRDPANHSQRNTSLPAALSVRYSVDSGSTSIGGANLPQKRRPELRTRPLPSSRVRVAFAVNRQLPGRDFRLRGERGFRDAGHGMPPHLFDRSVIVPAGRSGRIGGDFRATAMSPFRSNDIFGRNRQLVALSSCDH
jgi:hypothetical protein